MATSLSSDLIAASVTGFDQTVRTALSRERQRISVRHRFLVFPARRASSDSLTAGDQGEWQVCDRQVLQRETSPFAHMRSVSATRGVEETPAPSGRARMNEAWSNSACSSASSQRGMSAAGEAQPRHTDRHMREERGIHKQRRQSRLMKACSRNIVSPHVSRSPSTRASLFPATVP